MRGCTRQTPTLVCEIRSTQQCLVVRRRGLHARLQRAVRTACTTRRAACGESNVCSRTGRPAQLTREAGAATQCRLGGTGTITPVHIVYRRRQSARCGTCRPRMRPSVRSRHRPRTHRSASSGPSMRRSAAAHCSACRLTRSGRKRRKTDARSKLNRSQAWHWPGRASAVPAEVRIVAARGYLNKRCSNIAPMQACR